MLNAELQEQQWKLVKYAQAIVLPLGNVSMLFGLIVLAGYFGNIETLYRPITNGPATHPLTATCIFFLGYGLRLNRKIKKDRWLRMGCALVVITITSFRFFDAFSHFNTLPLVTPFQNQVMSDLASGKNNSMGLNSAVMFFCNAIALFSYCFGKSSASQLVAFVAMAIPTVSFTGYAYNLEHFYGQMSLLTATAGFTIALAALGMTSNNGGLKAMLSPYIGGKVARLQAIAGFAFPTLLGFLIIKSLASSEGSYFGIFVVSICWFIIFMVSLSAIFQEEVDSERRKGERLLSQAATSDPLTGLPNRRKLQEFGQAEINRVQRNNNQFFILILDIDYFKKINDTAGHDMGDRVLVKLAETLKNSARVVDLVSRIGGEEFAIILVDTGKEGAERVAEHIRLNIENIEIDGWTNIYGPITASIGGTSNQGNNTLEESIKVADKALYQAKQKGRNQVCFAECEQD